MTRFSRSVGLATLIPLNRYQTFHYTTINKYFFLFKKNWKKKIKKRYNILFIVRDMYYSVIFKKIFKGVTPKVCLYLLLLSVEAVLINALFYKYQEQFFFFWVLCNRFCINKKTLPWKILKPRFRRAVKRN